MKSLSITKIGTLVVNLLKPVRMLCAICFQMKREAFCYPEVTDHIGLVGGKSTRSRLPEKNDMAFPPHCYQPDSNHVLKKPDELIITPIIIIGICLAGQGFYSFSSQA